MNLKHLTTATLACGLAFGLTGCFGTPTPEETASASQEGTGTKLTQPQDTAERENSGFAEALDVAELPLTQKVAAPEDSTLNLNAEMTFTVKGSGLTAHSSNKRQAAHGEVLHAIQYESDGFTGDIKVLADGKAVDTLLGVPSEGFIIVSAPIDASLALSFPYEKSSVEQTIDVETGERLSAGVADAWYLPSEGSISNGLPKTVATHGAITVFNTEVLSAQRSPYVLDNGWADEGRQAWLSVTVPAPEITIENDLSIYDTECAIVAIGEKGERYETKDIFSPEINHAETFHFLVPTTTDTFKVEMSCSAGSVEEFGEKVAVLEKMTNTATITLK